MVAAFGGEVALLHSQLTPDERAEQWHRIRRGEARVVIGTRSAVFAPMPDLGLISSTKSTTGVTSRRRRRAITGGMWR
jgi:primosomal protein N'